MRSPTDHDYESVAQSVDVQVHDDELIHSVLSRDTRALRSPCLDLAVWQVLFLPQHRRRHHFVGGRPLVRHLVAYEMHRRSPPALSVQQILRHVSASVEQLREQQ